MDSFQKSATSGSRSHHQQPQFPVSVSTVQSQSPGASSVDFHERIDTQSPRRKPSPAEIPGSATTSHSPHPQQPQQFAYHSPGPFVVQPNLETYMRQQQELHHIAQIQNQIIQIGGSSHHPLRHVSGIHLQEFQYFPQGLLPGTGSLQVHRTEEIQRPSNSYPINTVFVSNDDKSCCLVDRGIRCSRAAGTAGFTLRIRELVARNGALLTEDTSAGHQYICDYHKNYIQKLRVVMPPGQNFPPLANSSGNLQSIFTQFPVDSFVLHSAAQQHQFSNQTSSRPDQSLPNVEQEKERPSRMNSASPQKAHTVADSRTKESGGEGHNNTPVDMRKHQSQDIRAVTTSTSPETEASDSSEEEYDGGPAPSELLYGLAESFSMEELMAYLKQFEIEVSPRSSKEDIAKIVSEHMDSVPVTDIKSSLLNFFHAVKTDTRHFSQPYKPSLNADFDLSSDEEMLLIDGSTGVVQAESSDDEGLSNDETDYHLENGLELPEMRFDPEVERTLSRIHGKVTADDIERILDKYSLPARFSHIAHDSDSESSSSEGNAVGKRDNRKKRKFRNANN